MGFGWILFLEEGEKGCLRGQQRNEEWNWGREREGASVISHFPSVLLSCSYLKNWKWFFFQNEKWSENPKTSSSGHHPSCNNDHLVKVPSSTWQLHCDDESWTCLTPCLRLNKAYRRSTPKPVYFWSNSLWGNPETLQSMTMIKQVILGLQQFLFILRPQKYFLLRN